ncbi:MAG: 6-hydroxymethylpterin diphosphokinase MptE-like protein [Candidatus Heimdallarchaeota archaeon]
MDKYKQLEQNEYEKIIKLLDIKPRFDKKATKILHKMLNAERVNKSLMNLEKCLKNAIVFIFGAGPSLENSIEQVKSILANNQTPIKIIAVDGAAKALLDNDLKIDVIVSDFDGSIPTIIKSHEINKTILLLHAHGDNIPSVKKVKQLLQKENVVGTTQISETTKVKNFGGFTDGDRAAYLASNMAAKVVVLFAFDFGDKIGRYSKPEIYTENVPITERKSIKLSIAKKLLSKLPGEFDSINFYNCTPKGEPILNIETINYDKLKLVI